MHYVYILYSPSSGKWYIGRTSRSVKRRLEEHNSGSNAYTRQHTPWKFVYAEVYTTKDQAVQREQALKQYGSAWGHLKKRITK